MTKKPTKPKKPTKAEKAKARKAQHEAEALSSRCFWGGLGLSVLGVGAAFLSAGAGASIAIGGIGTVALSEAADMAAKAAKKTADDPPVPHPHQGEPFRIRPRDMTLFIGDADAQTAAAIRATAAALDHLEAYAESVLRAAHAADTDALDDLNLQLRTIAYYGGGLTGSLETLNAALAPMAALFDVHTLAPKHIRAYVSGLEAEGLTPDVLAAATKGLRMSEDEIAAYRKRAATIDPERDLDAVATGVKSLRAQVPVFNAAAREFTEAFALDIV
ncbi:hypothetical protein [Breoghania sp. L-A4]|uniref:hypothetical protein n=1 Tax=Breoghania sp. L-A4 TaxID=2304600 RepID=UPI0013C358A9|nr:hypothetical protein [Breoghania sp. L-A4]